MSNWPDKRASAAICYLDAAVRARSNLTIVNRATVTAIAVRRPPRHRREGKRCRRRDVEFRGREIIVSLGGIHSPAMLMRSGIGPAGHLRDHGIAVRADLPGVGAQSVQPRHPVRRRCTCKPQARQAPSLRPHPTTVFRFSSGRAGLPARPTCTSTCSARPRGARSASRSPTSRRRCGSRWRAGGCRSPRPIRGRSRWSNSTSPATSSTCSASCTAFRRAVEMLAHAQVRAMSGVTFPVKFTDRLRRLNRVTRANALKSAAIAKLHRSGSGAAPARCSRRWPTAGSISRRWSQDDEALAEHIRENVAGTFHPVGTCRMGAADDRDAVVDPAGRVRGVRRTARRRRLDHADAAARQHQHSDHHAGGKNRRRHRRRRGRVIR